MKKLGRILSLLLAVCLLNLPVFASADGEPTLDGVHDQSVMAGTEFDPRAGLQEWQSNPREPR